MRKNIFQLDDQRILWFFLPMKNCPSGIVPVCSVTLSLEIILFFWCSSRIRDGYSSYWNYQTPFVDVKHDHVEVDCMYNLEFYATRPDKKTYSKYQKIKVSLRKRNQKSIGRCWNSLTTPGMRKRSLLFFAKKCKLLKIIWSWKLNNRVGKPWCCSWYRTMLALFQARNIYRCIILYSLWVKIESS